MVGVRAGTAPPAAPWPPGGWTGRSPPRPLCRPPTAGPAAGRRCRSTLPAAPARAVVGLAVDHLDPVLGGDEVERLSLDEGDLALVDAGPVPAARPVPVPIEAAAHGRYFGDPTHGRPTLCRHEDRLDRSRHAVSPPGPQP